MPSRFIISPSISTGEKWLTYNGRELLADEDAREYLKDILRLVWQPHTITSTHQVVRRYELCSKILNDMESFQRYKEALYGLLARRWTRRLDFQTDFFTGNNLQHQMGLTLMEIQRECGREIEYTMEYATLRNELRRIIRQLQI